MARANKRNEVLEAVVRIVERDGLTAVTLDAVAAETGLTRAGILYHFPSREALIFATHEHMSQSWEREIEASAGKPAAEASAAERSRAYVRASSRTATRGELLMALESLNDEKIAALWHDLANRWVSPAPSGEDPAELDAFIARIAADGLWIHEAMTGHSMSEDMRRKVVARLLEMAG